MKVVVGVVISLLLVSLAGARPQAPSAEYGPPGYPKGGPGGSGGGDGGSGGSGGGGGGGSGDGDGVTEEANYSFAYEVKDEESGNDFGHQETRMGDVAMGSYHVLLPDGRMQKVEYTADKDGYKPVVTYEGEVKGYGPEVGGGTPGGGGGGAPGGGGGGAPAAPAPSYGPPKADGGGYRYKR